MESTHTQIKQWEIFLMSLIAVPLEPKQTETFIVHVGHNSIVKGISVQEAVIELKDTVDGSMLNF